MARPTTKDDSALVVLDLERYVLALLVFLANKLTSGASTLLRRHFGVGTTEWRIMALLAIEPWITANRICKVIGFDKADPALVPDTHWLDDPAWRSIKGGYTHYDTNYLLICDNLLDLAHLPYVHPTTLGGSEDYARSPVKVERIERGVRVTRWALDIASPPFIQKVTSFPDQALSQYRWIVERMLEAEAQPAPVVSSAAS